MSEKFTIEQLDILEAASQHSVALTSKELEAISFMQRRLANWGHRGNFVTYREARILEKVEIKLQRFVDKIRAKRQHPIDAERTHQNCKKILQDLNPEPNKLRGTA